MYDKNYTDLPPLKGESCTDYCARLEADGYDEMFIRKALRTHFQMSIEELAPSFDAFPLARFRHIAIILNLRPWREPAHLRRKVAKNLGLNQEEAADWIERFDHYEATV